MTITRILLLGSLLTLVETACLAPAYAGQRCCQWVGDKYVNRKTSKAVTPPEARRAGIALGQIPRLGLEPLADVPGALLAISRPVLRETVVDDVVALDTERVLDELGGAISVIAVDRLLEQIGHGYSLTNLTAEHYRPSLKRANFSLARPRPAAWCLDHNASCEQSTRCRNQAHGGLVFSAKKFVFATL